VSPVRQERRRIVQLRDPEGARIWCDGERARGASLGFVPTMGALHAGHLELVRRAAAENDACVVSVFVNPLQFNDPEDFAKYPRQFEEDARLLDGAGCAMVFTGALAQFFPGQVLDDTRIDPRFLLDPGAFAEGLEGARRPGHFQGVATIVDRLFDLVRPARAYFGEKDYQQSLVVRDLARRRGGPAIVMCPTSREASGLARSSRNERLLPAERERAAGLFEALQRARELWRAGERDAARLGRALRERLESRGLEVEYAELRDPERWTAADPRGELQRAVALVAARIGHVRLIDNLRLDAPSAPS
jgi:pantoate--beta-alanine ligase